MFHLAVALLVTAGIVGILGATGAAWLAATLAWILFAVDLIRAVVRISRQPI